MRQSLRALAPVLALLIAQSARADDFTLDNVTMDTALARYSAARVEVYGAPFTKDEALRLLDPAQPLTYAERLARLDAARIVIPELVTQTHAGDYTQTTTYRDIVLNGVLHGKVAMLDSAGAAVESRRGEANDMKGKVGAMHAEGVDIIAGVRMTMTARGADAQKQIAVARFSASGVDAITADRSRLHIDTVTGADIGGRALAAPLGGLIELTPKKETKPTPDQERAVAGMTMDMVESIDMGALELKGVAFATADDKPPARIARIAIAGASDGRIRAVAIEGLDTQNAFGPVKLAQATIEGYDMRPTLAGARETPARKVLPRFDKAALESLSVAGAKGPIGVDRASIAVTQWLDFAPLAFSASADHIRAPVESLPLFAGLGALGYDSVDLSARIETAYDSATNVVAVRHLVVDDPHIGSADLSLSLGAVSPDVLAKGGASAMVPAMTARFLSFGARLQDHGLVDRAVATQARQKAIAPEAARKALADALGAGVLAIAGLKASDPRAAPLIGALTAFMAGGKTLEASIVAPDGPSLLELTMAAQFGTLLDKLKIEASAR
ncbi:MAG: hypothetical protein KGL46_07110 [Hyphomicrobiales bacterium]|nr:hypothetical protein [Hyphomicrobiales bacterium]